MIKKSLIVASFLIYSTNAVANTTKNSKSIVKSLQKNNIYIGLEFGTVSLQSTYKYDSNTVSSYHYQVESQYSNIGLKIGTKLDSTSRAYFTLYQINSDDSVEMKMLSYDKIYNTESECLKVFIGGSYADYSIQANDASVDISGNSLMINLGTIIKTKDNIELEFGYKHSLMADGSDTIAISETSSKSWNIDAMQSFYFGINYKF